MIDGYTKADPPTQKKLPVEADVPELLLEMGYGKSGSIQLQAVGESSLIAFYYLLRIGEYTVKRQRDRSKRAKKQTVNSNWRMSLSSRQIKMASCGASHGMPRTLSS
jgi:hypothetical protein